MESTYSRQYERLWRGHWWWQVRHRVIRDLLGKVLRRTNEQNRPCLLDIGCGGGWAFDDFSRLAEVHGLEPDAGLTHNSPWKPRIEHGAFDASYDPPRRYDVILMLDVLEHIADDAGAVDHVMRLLNPGGHFLLTVPALPSLWSVHDEANHHFRRYRFDGLQSLLARQGMALITIRYLFGWSLGLVYLRRWLARSAVTDYHVHVPPACINMPFRLLSLAEEWLARTFAAGPPLGSTLLALARKPDRGTAREHAVPIRAA